ncbi:MAG: oligosaccharide flippase family protein [Oscillospiraceae bacterium]|nr:oligosaccharide flippase family protein [Oscillospiraceae bacterium]
MISKIRKKWQAIPLTVKVSTAYAICSILQRCLSFFTLPLFTRLLTTDQYGQYTVYQSWSNIITIFVTLNLAYGSFSTAMVKYEQRRSEYVSSIQGICIMLTAAFLGIYIPFSDWFNQFFEMPTYLMVVMLLEILFTCSLQLWMAKNRFEYKYKSVVIVTLVNSLVAPIAAFVLVTLTEEKGIARILGYAFAYIAVGGFFFVYNILKGKKLYDKELWSYALGFNVPLLVYYLSQVVFNQSDRIMINHYCGTEAAAMYGVAFNLAMILTFVLNSINGSYVPWFYGKLKEGKAKDNQGVACGIAVLLGILLLAVIWYAPEIILVMAGPQYVDAIPVVAPVAMSILLLYYSQLFINLEFYYEEKKLLALASIASAVVNIVLNAWLIPKISFVAAGYTTFVSYILFAFCNYLAVRGLINHGRAVSDAYNIKALLGIFVLFVAASGLGMLLYDYLVWRIVITLLVLVVMFIFRNKLLGVFKTIKNR